MSQFSRNIRPHVDAELLSAVNAEAIGDYNTAFKFLERAHVLGQPSTYQHVRIHFKMLLLAMRHHKLRESLGQILRIGGAATKTAVGLIPEGNTGGSNISPFKPLPIPTDLASLLQQARK